MPHNTHIPCECGQPVKGREAGGGQDTQVFSIYRSNVTSDSSSWSASVTPCLHFFNLRCKSLRHFDFICSSRHFNNSSSWQIFPTVGILSKSQQKLLSADCKRKLKHKTKKNFLKVLSSSLSTTASLKMSTEKLYENFLFILVQQAIDTLTKLQQKSDKQTQTRLHS